MVQAQGVDPMFPECASNDAAANHAARPCQSLARPGPAWPDASLGGAGGCHCHPGAISGDRGMSPRRQTLSKTIIKAVPESAPADEDGADG